MPIVEPNHDAEVLEQRRRHWLGLICAGLLVAIALGVWWHVEDPFNPYRDGTTHAATLVHASPDCLNWWQVELDGDRYVWQAAGGVPASLGPGPIEGEVHITRQRSMDVNRPSATFKSSGVTIPLFGGRAPVFFPAVCAIR